MSISLAHGSATMCILQDKKKGANLTLKLQIPHPTQVELNSPTLWKAFHVKCAIPQAQEMVNCPGDVEDLN